MERPHSRRRRPCRTQEPQLAAAFVSPRKSHALLTWTFVACLLIVVAYVLRVDFPLRSWVPPLSFSHSDLHESASAIRPRIALRPENHVYRPPATQYLHWHVTSGERRPDGVLKQVYLINGIHPIYCGVQLKRGKSY